MPTASWRRRCSPMGSGKRASMREGPLAALFRKTETEGVEPPAAAAQPAANREPERERPAAPRIPTPQERLRHAFSSDVPEDVMAPSGRQVPPPSASDYQWDSTGA